MNALQPADLARSKSFVPPALSTTRTTFDKLRVAVLPLQNLSPDPKDEYFADGMTEELIDRLAQVKSLKIIARTSVMKYKGSQKGVSEVAKELSIGTLIEGSVRKAGDKIRVTVQLIKTDNEEHIWSSHYDKNLDDIFTVQSEIAEKVATELKAQLLDSEKTVLEKKPTQNTEAYTLFLQGRELLRIETEASLKQALTLLEKAIELDQKFARAYVAVADCHLTLGRSGYEPADVARPNVKRALERAIELDPTLPEAHSSLSEMLFNQDDLTGMEAEAKKALELNPSLPEPYSSLSELVGIKKEESAERVKLMETAYSLDPISPRLIWLLGLSYLYAGREQDAFDHWTKAETLAPAFVYRGLIEYYLIKSELGKAREFYLKAEKLVPTNPRLISIGGVIAAMEGNRELALQAIRKIEDANMGPIGFNYVGYIYHALGDMDAYFENMKQAFEEGVLIPSIMMHSPLFAKARTDPRYSELVRKLRKQAGIGK